MDAAQISASGAEQDDDSVLFMETINWKEYQVSANISKNEHALLDRFDKQPEDVQMAYFQKEGEAYAELFTTVLRHINDGRVIEYVLTLVDKYLLMEPDLAVHFRPLQENPALSPLNVLFKLLKMQDSLGGRYVNVLSRACHVAGALMNKDVMPAAEDSQKFVAFITETLASRTMFQRGCVNNVFYALQMVLRSETSRLQFNQLKGPQMLVEFLIQPAQNIQLLYQICNCLWMLSYTKVIAQGMVEMTLVQALVNILKTVEKDKVIRMALAILRNLCDVATNDKTESGRKHRGAKEYMVDVDMLKVLQHVKHMGIEDEETVADITFLEEKLESGLQDMSTFDEYRKEVFSNLVDGWTPVHKQQTFWQQNVFKFEERNFEILRHLVEIINPSKGHPERSVNIALHDIGQFITHYPKGKQIIENLKAKAAIMMWLADNASPEDTRKEALLCVQKMMIY
jgi:V-type H+-transporting ATPase subunit H